MRKGEEEFKERFEREQIKGLYKWLPDDYYEACEIVKFMEEIIEKREFDSLSLKQQTMVYLIRYTRHYVLEMKEMPFKFDELDEESIDEIIAFYNLKNPKKRYEEIRKAIHSPQNYMTRIPYSLISKLYQIGKVPFDREIFLACLVRFNVWHMGHYSKEFGSESSLVFEEIFPQEDAVTLEILMGIFEMEVGVISGFYLHRDFNIGAVIHRLIANGKLDKITIQHKIFEAFNNPLLKQNTQAWFKDIYNDLELSVEEELRTQEKTIALLFNDKNLLANNAVKIIKKISKEPTFNWKLLIDSLEGIVYREKFNGGLKTILTLLFKQLKKEPKLLEACSCNLAPIFLQPDAKVKAEAVKIFKLVETPNEKIIEALAPFVNTLPIDIQEELSDFIEEKREILLESYQQKSYCPNALESKNEINYIQNEDDFIFLASKVLKSESFIDYELFIEALSRFYGLYESHKKILKPALKLAEKSLQRSDVIHYEILARLIISWLQPQTPSMATQIAECKKELNNKEHIYLNSYCLNSVKLFSHLTNLDSMLREGKTPLPFLSTPTHNDGQIHPQTLLDRLKLYLSSKQKPDEVDFDFALCRLNRWTNFKKVQPSTEHEAIVLFLLDEKANVPIEKIDQLTSSWLTALTLKSPKKGLFLTLEYRNHRAIDWKTDKEWDWELIRVDNWTKFELHINSIEGNEILDSYLFKIAPHFNALSSYFDLPNRFVKDTSHWFSRNPHLVEFIYLKSLYEDYQYLNYLEASEVRSVMGIVIQSTQRLQPLGSAGYLFLVMSLFTKENSIRMATFDWFTQLVEHHYLDIDTFSNTFTKVLANPHENFIPIARVATQFEEMIQLEGVYLDILEKIFHSLLPKIQHYPLPTGFKRLLQSYYDLLLLTEHSLPDDVREALEEMKNVSAVKKIVKLLKEERDSAV